MRLMPAHLTPMLSAILALTTLTPVAARPGVGLGEAFPQTCASGYHPDKGGNCQPNGGESNRYCPDGTVFEPTFDGWYCGPPPPEAY
jgi:hypothetical protein